MVGFHQTWGKSRNQMRVSMKESCINEGLSITVSAWLPVDIEYFIAYKH